MQIIITTATVFHFHKPVQWERESCETSLKDVIIWLQKATLGAVRS